MMTMTRDRESIAPTACLLLAFELGQRSWKLGFSAGMGQRPQIRQIAAGAIGVIEKEILQAKMRLGLSLEAPVISCYEAGRDGFWVHRYLVAHGITNHVVDSASIEVNRRARRAKTDRRAVPKHILHFLARVLVTSADASHPRRKVERLVNTADDHYHADYGPPAAALRPPASDSRSTHRGPDRRHRPRSSSLDGAWVAERGADGRGMPGCGRPHGAGAATCPFGNAA